MDCFSKNGDLDVRVEVEEIGVERPEWSVAMMGVIKKKNGRKKISGTSYAIQYVS